MNGGIILCLGIEGAFSGAGAKTVIPRKVIGKFSIRLVPDMQPSEVEKLVCDYVNKLHKDHGSPNIMRSAERDLFFMLSLTYRQPALLSWSS